MLRLSKLHLLAVPFIILGCEPASQSQVSIEPCSNLWFDYIEKRLITGDAQGHGPDVGSSEWQSVVEFKLGIREDNDVPDLNTEMWCIYIDDLVKARALNK